MAYLYHGSSTHNLKFLIPNKSTHGVYVYATPYKELATIFSSRCGDDATYSLYRNSKNEPWKLVERIPGAFKTMFTTSSSIYTVEDTTFEDKQTGFAEVLSNQPVNVIKEEYLENVYEEVKKLKNQGLVELYYYPNLPEDFELDKNDLIKRYINYNKGIVSTPIFMRLLFLHPELLDKVNEVLRTHKQTEYTKENLVEMYEVYIKRQLENPETEYYIQNAFESISNVYPELVPPIKEIIEKNKITRKI